MDCREVHDHLGDAVDRELAGMVRERFFSHLRLCPRCHIEYLCESIGKILVRKHLPHVRTPPDLQSAIIRQIEAAQPIEGQQKSLLIGFFRRHPVPSLVSGIASIALILFLSLPRGTHELSVAGLAPNDIIRQAHENFMLIRKGEFTPAMVSYERDLVVGFFEKNNNRFAVAVPHMEGCDWYGATTGEFGDALLAHVVYKIGNDYLYLYQVEWDKVGTGSTLSLPEAVLASLRETGWYSDINHAECNIILYTLNGTLCAAASTLSKERMLALLAYR